MTRNQPTNQPTNRLITQSTNDACSQADSNGRTAYAHALRAGRADVANLLSAWSTPQCCPTHQNCLSARRSPNAQPQVQPAAGLQPCHSLCVAALAGDAHAPCARFLLRAKAAVDMYDFNVRAGIRP